MTTRLPRTASSGVTQERTALPSTWTVQAPQAATPQPNLVPVRPSRSRSAHSSGICGAASSSGRARDAPLTTISTPLLAAGRRLCPCARIRPRAALRRGALSPVPRSARPRFSRMLRSLLAAALATAAALCSIDVTSPEQRPLRPDRRLRQPQPAARRRVPLAARQRQHVAHLPRLSRQRRPGRRPAGGVPARVVLRASTPARPAATAAMPSGAATPTSASRARSAAPCSAATSRRST